MTTATEQIELYAVFKRSYYPTLPGLDSTKLTDIYFLVLPNGFVWQGIGDFYPHVSWWPCPNGVHPEADYLEHIPMPIALARSMQRMAKQHGY